jgi:hypothetical protein
VVRYLAMIQEARLEAVGSGVAPVTDGWFVVNVLAAAWLTTTPSERAGSSRATDQCCAVALIFGVKGSTTWASRCRCSSPDSRAGCTTQSPSRRTSLFLPTGGAASHGTARAGRPTPDEIGCSRLALRVVPGLGPQPTNARSARGEEPKVNGVHVQGQLLAPPARSFIAARPPTSLGPGNRLVRSALGSR